MTIDCSICKATTFANIGFIKSVSPILDFNMVEKESIWKTDIDKQQQQSKHNEISKALENENEGYLNNQIHYSQQQDTRGIKKGVKIKLDCEFCKGPISANPYVYRFANYERFFCCKGCMSDYKRKYAVRIESIIRKFEEREI
jgi:hypothetical protein